MYSACQAKGPPPDVRREEGRAGYDVDQMFRLQLAVLVAIACLVPAIGGAAGDNQDAEEAPRRRALIDGLKKVESRLGFGATRNFARADDRVSAYYRCYYTGPLELPESYTGLRLRSGTQNGCFMNPTKYDVFFYPIEAVASGRAPVTRALEAASEDRVAMVVPHEDFHAQVRDLPGAFAEAAATLVGFLTADEFRDAGSGHSGATGEADLFLRKAEIVNRYYGRIRELYRSVREGLVPRAAGLERKRLLFSSLERECGAIAPAPRSFNRCLSAANNAGLAFDHTYTVYYPLLYRVFVAQGRDLRATIQAIENAPKTRRERDVARYFSEIAEAGRERRSQPVGF